MNEMNDRLEISMDDLESVTGGALKWVAKGKIVYPIDNPNAVYHYKSYSKCIAFIQQMGPIAEQNEDTLKALMQEGLVYQD